MIAPLRPAPEQCLSFWFRIRKVETLPVGEGVVQVIQMAIPFDAGRDFVHLV